MIYQKLDSENEFKVNKWMRRQGFIWEVTPGTPESPNPFNGIWVQLNGDSDPVEQDEAVRMYTTRRRWWQL